MPSHAQAARISAAAQHAQEADHGRDESLYYDWFAGWRWEQHRNGGLLAESPQSFETKDDCMRDADEHRRHRRMGLATRRD